MNQGVEDFCRYLPPDKQSRRWGWRLLDAGQQTVLPGAEYPSSNHPQRYLFDRSGRRTLDEFQIVTILSGSGVFSSRLKRNVEVRAGDSLLLFPGEWHRYFPLKNKGWKEYWLGFKGQDAERVMAAFFNPKTPVIHSVHSEEIREIYERLFGWLQSPVAGVEQILASHIPLLLSFLQSGYRAHEFEKMSPAYLAREAKSRIFQNSNQRTDLTKLAKSLGVSYSKFRSIFKQETGFSPRDYENHIKLTRAYEWLQSGNTSVSAVANSLGYSSIYYFSRSFKKRFGICPSRVGCES